MNNRVNTIGEANQAYAETRGDIGIAFANASKETATSVTTARLDRTHSFERAVANDQRTLDSSYFYIEYDAIYERHDANINYRLAMKSAEEAFATKQGAAGIDYLKNTADQTMFNMALGNSASLPPAALKTTYVAWLDSIKTDYQNYLKATHIVCNGWDR